MEIALALTTLTGKITDKPIGFISLSL